MATAPVSNKFKVTMTTITSTMTADGVRENKHEAVDFVPTEILDSYVADAKTKWQSVTVSDKPEAGPGGDKGKTTIPAHLTKEA